LEKTANKELRKEDDWEVMLEQRRRRNSLGHTLRGSDGERVNVTFNMSQSLWRFNYNVNQKCYKMRAIHIL